MGPIIRISDETFSRLKRIAEPFIDTPSSVIEGLLDLYEGKALAKKKETYAEQKMESHHHPNIYLAPAISENLEKTIKGSVSLDQIRPFLSQDEITRIEQTSGEPNSLHCWAMSYGSKAEFDSMRQGDAVLFTMKGTGKFQYYGEVAFKTDNERLGEKLWKVVPYKPWRLIYFLINVEAINVDKQRLVTELKYKSNYSVPGITRVKDIATEIILKHFSTIKMFVESLNS